MVNQSNDQDQEFESRTKKKHFAHSMVDLAHKLAEMKHSDMIMLPISEQVIDTVVASKKITSHIARKRHFQFLGKFQVAMVLEYPEKWYTNNGRNNENESRIFR